MTRNKVLLLLQSLLCIILVVMLAAAAISIYKTGIAERQENPLAWVYTREKVAAALKPVIPVFLLAVGVTVVGSILGIRDEQQDKPVKDAELTRDLMVSRVAEPDDAMKKERALQKKLLVGGWAAFAVCMLPVVLYMVNGSHFQNGDLEVMFRSFAGHVLPWVAAGIACLMISALLQGKSMQCEADAASARIKEEKGAGDQALTEARCAAERSESRPPCDSGRGRGVHHRGHPQRQYDRRYQQGDQDLYGVCRPWIMIM